MERLETSRVSERAYSDCSAVIIENTKRMKEKIKRNNASDAYNSKGRNIGQSKSCSNANSLYIIKKWKTINVI